MYELDHMLNGKGSRSHIEEIAAEVRAEKISREVENDQNEEKTAKPVRNGLLSVVSMLVRGA